MRFIAKLSIGMSMIVTAALVVFWVRSFWSEDHLFYWRQNSKSNVTYFLWSSQGHAGYHQIGRERGHLSIEEAVPNVVKWRTEQSPGSAAAYDSREMFRYKRFTKDEIAAGSVYSYGLLLRIPYWMLVMVAAVPALIGLLVLRRLRSSAYGTCPVCGYDLRATPDRCPECGYVPAHEKQ